MATKPSKKVVVDMEAQIGTAKDDLNEATPSSSQKIPSCRPVPQAATLRTTNHTMRYSRTRAKDLDECPFVSSASPLLPPQMRRKHIFKYDPQKYDLRGAIADILSQLDPELIGDWKNEEKILEDFVVPGPSLEQPTRRKKAKKSSSSSSDEAQKTLTDAIGCNEAFLALFDEFICDHVAPWIKSQLLREGAATGEGETIFYYQRPPTLRIQPGPSTRYVRPHNDAAYGHQDGELNFWMPLTDTQLTGTELWAESCPGKEDFAPLGVNFGEVAAFHGTYCKHYAPANPSPHTRVSLDFRIGVGGYFDPNWQMSGALLHKARYIEVT